MSAADGLPAVLRRVPAFLLALAPAVPAQEQDQGPALAELSLAELMALEVTSVSRKPQSVNQSAAAVFVITREDIRRSGHTSLPELLRMVPGVHVARVNSNAWAVGIRGFNGRFSDKLLVMIDGRTVYTNLFSGVWWDEQDYPLEDIERIEVIRGPGGATWGANAVNGVINIITRSAADTQGTLASLLVGDEDRGIASVRHGGPLGAHGHYRAYAKWTDRDASASTTPGADDFDPWSYGRGGFRMDWPAGERDGFTLQGDAYRGRVRERYPLLSPFPPFDATIEDTFRSDGANVLGRWTRTFSDDADLALQVYVDHTARESDVTADRRDTYDLDYQQRQRLARHELVWGLGYRLIDSRFAGFEGIAVDPVSRSDGYASGFVQDQVTLGRGWSLILGTKLEYNEFTHAEVSPTLRAIWTAPEGDRSVWAAVSRAVRIPNVVDDSLILPVQVIPGSPNTVVTLFGNQDFESEEVLAWELGARWQPHERLMLDAALFYDDYDNLATLEPGAPFFDGTNVVAPLTFGNLSSGRSLGGELAASCDVTDRWRLQGTFSVLELEVVHDAASQDQDSVQADELFPKYLASLRSECGLSEDVELDLALYGTDGFRGTAGFLRADARLAWHPRPNLELSLVLQNACDPKHPEFGSDLVSLSTEIERSAYVKVAWTP